jgi:hypothetical protein
MRIIQSEKPKMLFVLIALTILVSTATLQIEKTFAQQPRIYLEPSIYEFPESTPVGTTFNVSVWCADVPDLGGAQIYMEFNDSIIMPTRWWAPTWDPDFFMPTTPPPTTLPQPPDPGYINLAPGKGRILIAVSKGGLPPSAPWGHDGIIAIIEFNITRGPPPTLTTLLDINKTDTYLLDPTANEIPNVIKENGTYTLIPELSTIMMIVVLLTSISVAVIAKKKRLL